MATRTKATTMANPPAPAGPFVRYDDSMGWNRPEAVPTRPSLSELTKRVGDVNEHIRLNIAILQGHADLVFGPGAYGMGQVGESATERRVTGAVGELEREIDVLEAALPYLVMAIERFEGHAA